MILLKNLFNLLTAGRVNMALQNMKNQSLKPKHTLNFNVLLPCKHCYSFRKYKSSLNQNLMLSLSDLKENDAGKIKRRPPWTLHNHVFFSLFKKFGNRSIGGGLKEKQRCRPKCSEIVKNTD